MGKIEIIVARHKYFLKENIYIDANVITIIILLNINELCSLIFNPIKIDA
jgi:hypothetical protein